jgi:predicted 3-demethylubiquinone-9 3-methyltransferase (glyoxalase superfamily)
MSMFTTCLWFQGEASEAAEFWVSVFPSSRITHTERYPDNSGDLSGTVITVAFELDGQPFLGLNGGPQFAFTEAVSLQVPCADQTEIDHYWSALLADGGEEGRCGWLKDRFGFSWQVVPSEPIFRGEDGPEANMRVNTALMQMGKLDLAALEAARRGE